MRAYWNVKGDVRSSAWQGIMRGYYAATLLTQRQVGSALVSRCGHASRGPWLVACHRSTAASLPPAQPGGSA